MAKINGWGRGTWGQLTFGEPLPVTITGVTSGATAVGSVGVIASSNSLPTNVIGTTAVNSVGLITNNILPITLGAATGSVNSVSPSAAANIFPTEVNATGTLGNILVWSLIDDSQTPNYSIISTTQTPSWSEVA